MSIRTLFDNLHKSLSDNPRFETGIPAVNDAMQINTMNFMDGMYRAVIEEETRCLAGYYPIVDSILQARYLAGYDVVEDVVRGAFTWDNILRIDEEDPRIPMRSDLGALEINVEDIEENNNPEFLDLLRIAIRTNRFAELNRAFHEVGGDDDLGPPYVVVEHSQQMPRAFQEFQHSFNPLSSDCMQNDGPVLYTTRFWFDTSFGLRLKADVTAELPPRKSFTIYSGNIADRRYLDCYFGIRWMAQELLSAFKQQFPKEHYGDTLGDPVSVETIREAIKEKFPEGKTRGGVAIELDEFSRSALEKIDNGRLRHRLRLQDAPTQYVVLCVNDWDDHLHINGLYSVPKGPLEQMDPVWHQDLTIIENKASLGKPDVKEALIQTPGFFDSDRIYLDVLWPWFERKLKGGDYVVV